jgi:ubiquinone/menaquinone biosynthesis C-methylase UbiE
MYSIYNRTRAYLFRLLDANFGTETERMKYFSSFVSDYEFDSLLDLGCGKGLLFDSIASSDKTKFLVGIDLMKVHKRKHPHVVASATKLPFRDSIFSLVAAFSLIEHIPKDERKMFYKEAKRVMKKRGIFVIQFPNGYFIIESHTFFPFFWFPAFKYAFVCLQTRIRCCAFFEGSHFFIGKTWFRGV